MIALARIARVARGCPPSWKLTRAVSQGTDPRLGWHLAACRRCLYEYTALSELVAEMPTALPVPEALARGSEEAISVLLLASAPSQESSRRWAIPAIGATALAVIVFGIFVWGARHESRKNGQVPEATAASSESRVSIRAIGQARFSHVQRLPDEIVRLNEGTLELEVEPLHHNERFRVMTADADVEVRGTSFKVSAVGGNLVAVHVWRGRVDVRSLDGAFAVLDAGDDWVRTRSDVDPTTSAVTTTRGATRLARIEKQAAIRANRLLAPRPRSHQPERLQRCKHERRCVPGSRWSPTVADHQSS